MFDGERHRKKMISQFVAGAVFALAFTAPAAQSLTHSAWAIDPVGARISFSIDAVGYPTTKGEFGKFEGRIVVDLDHPQQSHVDFRVRAESVDVGSTSFNEYVRSAALLNTARFPDIAFESTSVEKIDDRHAHVLGQLTLLGVTHPLSVAVEIRSEGRQDHPRLGLVAQAKIDRLAFGMNSGFPVISREIDLTVAGEAFEQ
jgi:polyisoprenoid-binding protein YceI